MDGDATKDERNQTFYHGAVGRKAFRQTEHLLACFVGESEDNAAVGDPAHVPDRRDAAVVGIVLGTQVLQLQDLRFPLQLRAKQH